MNRFAPLTTPLSLIVLIGVIIAAGILFSSPVNGREISNKKGVGTWMFNSIDVALQDANVSWFYTWKPENTRFDTPESMAFVPMVWSEAHVTSKRLAAAKKSGPNLLGFNEPDHSGQANMSVAEALDLWPRLEATGLRLGSPATASNPLKANSWLARFMKGAADRGYRVDFVAVHWYGRDFNATKATHSLRAFLEGVHERFGLPIWVTEWGLVRWRSPSVYPTFEQQAAFAKQSVALLDRLDFVERYAWFSMPPFDDGDTLRLYEESGAITPVGLVYREAGTGNDDPSSVEDLPIDNSEPESDNPGPGMTIGGRGR